MPKKQKPEATSPPKATPFQFQFTLRGYVRAEQDETEEHRRTLTGFLEMVNADGEVILLKNIDGKPELQTGFWSWPNVTPEEATRRAEALQKRFAEEAPHFLLLEAGNFLQDMLWLVGGESDKDSDTVDYHIENTRDFLNKHFGFPAKQKRNRNGKLTKKELLPNLRDIRAALPKEQHTFPKVAEALKQRDPTRAPATGAALRVLCNRLGIKVDWIRKREGKSKRRSEANKK